MPLLLGGGGGVSHLASLALWGLLPSDTHPSTPGHRDSGAAENERSFIVRVTANSRAVSNPVACDPQPADSPGVGWVPFTPFSISLGVSLGSLHHSTDSASNLRS